MLTSNNLNSLLIKPHITFESLDWYYQTDGEGYLKCLLKVKSGIKDFHHKMLFTSGGREAVIKGFIIHHDTIFKVLNLNSIIDHFHLLEILQDDKVESEKIYSFIYYQLYFVIESINHKVHQVRESLHGPSLITVDNKLSSHPVS